MAFSRHWWNRGAGRTGNHKSGASASSSSSPTSSTSSTSTSLSTTSSSSSSTTSVSEYLFSLIVNAIGNHHRGYCADQRIDWLYSTFRGNSPREPGHIVSGTAVNDDDDVYGDHHHQHHGAMAVSMENPQDPERVHFAASPDTQQQQQQQLIEGKHASKYPKKHRREGLRWYLRRTVAGAVRFRWNARNATALGFSVVMTVLIVHRTISLYMSSRRWINAPITYMPRRCGGANYATILRPEEAGEVCVTTLTDARRYSPLQRFLRWRNFDGILELTWHNKWEYCQRHGYLFYDGSDHIDKSRPPAWSKIKAVQHLLQHERCDWVLWTDADTVVMNADRTIEEFLPADPTKDLLVGSDNGGGYNSGVFVVRNTAWSRRFLQEWWDMDNYVNPPGLSLSGDNHALKALLARMVDFDAHVLSPARCTFNSFAKFLALGESASVMDHLDEQPWYGSEDYYHKGDFLAHSPGYDNKEQVLRLLLQEAK